MKNISYLNKDETRGRLQDYKSFLYLMKFSKAYRLQISISMCLLFLSAMAVIYSAGQMGYLIEYGLLAKNWPHTVRIAAVIVTCEALAIFLTWQGRRLLARAATNSVFGIRKFIFNHINQLPISYYDREPQGRIVTRMTHDVEGIENFFNSSLGKILDSIIIFTFAMITMIISSPKLGVFLLLLILPSILLTFLTRKKIRSINRNMSKNNSACNSKLSEFLNGLTVIRSFGLENWSRSEYEKVVSSHLSSLMQANHFYSWSRPLTNLLTELPLLGLLFFGGLGVIDGTLSVGLFVAFIRYCERFSHPIANLTREIHVIQQAFTSAERVTTFLQEADETIALGQDGPLSADNLKGKIEFKNVSMSYNEHRFALDQLSFIVLPGEKIGLVGRTGSGKTSTVSLLSRLYEFQSGEILLDDVSIRKYNRSSLRKNIGFVSQDVAIFKGTLRDNLACGHEIAHAEIVGAIKSTGLGRVMLRNDLTLDTEILEGGSNLSVGERQLVSLTRVLLNKPQLLILDEATSNVDPEYENVIHQAVDLLMEKKTCIIVAHRLTTLKNCDKILVFQDGNLAEMGTHDQLMRRKGYFYQLQYENNFQRELQNIV